MCASTLLSFHQLYIICQSNNTRFLQSLEGEAYEHHVVKSHVVGVDTSELLELQSSFSREIENEILNMHESKEINEAESEIAANAAVKELERIGSAENISLVEDVAIDVLHSMGGSAGDVNHRTFKSESETSIKLRTSQRADNEKSTPRSKSKKEPIRKQAKVDESTKTNAKSRAVKTPKKVTKSPKTEILKENITRSKNKRAEREQPNLTNGKDVKENSCIDDELQTYVMTDFGISFAPCITSYVHFVFSLILDHQKNHANIVRWSLQLNRC